MCIVLENEKDFFWYKKELDLKQKHEHEHDHEPKEYPCKIRSSDYYFDPTPRYCHHFTYLQEVKCDKCGNAKKVWVNEED